MSLATQDARRFLDSLRSSSSTNFPGLSVDELIVHIDYTTVPPSIRLVTYDEFEAVHKDSVEYLAMVQFGLHDVKKSGGERAVVTWSCSTGKHPIVSHYTSRFDTFWNGFIRRSNVPSQRMAFHHVNPYPLQARWSLIDEILDRTKLTTAVLSSDDPHEEVRSKVKEAYDSIDLEWRLVVARARQEGAMSSSVQ